MESGGCLGWNMFILGLSILMKILRVFLGKKVFNMRR